MKDKFKDTKGLDKAYMSLAKHYDERKENVIRQVKDGAFVDLLNQEIEELQKAKQIEEIKKIIDDRCEAELGQVHASSKGGKVTKTVGTKLIAKDIYEYLNKDSVVLSREEYENIYEQAEQNVLANIADGGTSCHWCIEQHEKKANKETAEKILKWLDNNCVFGGFEIVKTWFKEQFGVEIKE